MLRDLFLSPMLTRMSLASDPCFVCTFVTSCFKAILFLGTPSSESFGADRSKDVIALLCIEACTHNDPSPPPRHIAGTVHALLPCPQAVAATLQQALMITG